MSLIHYYPIGRFKSAVLASIMSIGIIMSPLRLPVDFWPAHPSPSVETCTQLISSNYNLLVEQSRKLPGCCAPLSSRPSPDARNVTRVYLTLGLLKVP